MDQPNALVLFDIDGTLIRRAGAHHRQALVDAIRDAAGLESTTDGVNTAGMLDQDILTTMMTRAGMTRNAIRRVLPEVMGAAQQIYGRSCPGLERKVCPGVRRLLARLERRGVVAGLVTGNLTDIGWKKLERAGLRGYFRFGAFCEVARDRTGLVRVAVRHARQQGWLRRGGRVSLIGDHPNDVNAARANGIRSIAVGTGLVGMEELATHRPDLLIPDLRALELEMLL
jgi:phosphoglycolate phosphatase